MVPSNWEKIKVGQKKLHSLNSCNLFEVIQFIPKLLLNPFNMMEEISKVANGVGGNFQTRKAIFMKPIFRIKETMGGNHPRLTSWTDEQTY